MPFQFLLMHVLIFPKLRPQEPDSAFITVVTSCVHAVGFISPFTFQEIKLLLKSPEQTFDKFLVHFVAALLHFLGFPE